MKVGVFPSPLRYPGGKGKIANFMKAVFLKNSFVGAEYVEPYAGGASVALALLFEEYASHIHINDLNRSVYTFWKTVLSSPTELCDRIQNAELSVEEWTKQRALQHDPEVSDLDLAFSTFYLNRTSRSGILRGGIIGGKDQTGPWKMDARFNKPDLIERVRKIARFSSRITVTECDAADLIRSYASAPPQPTFLYIDPPYYVRGQDLYQNFYEPDDHKEISRLVKALQVPWMVSYDANPEVAKLYKGYQAMQYGLSYSAGGRYSGSELIFFGPGVDSLTSTDPRSVTTDDVRRLKIAVID